MLFTDSLPSLSLNVGTPSAAHLSASAANASGAPATSVALHGTASSSTSPLSDARLPSRSILAVATAQREGADNPASTCSSAHPSSSATSSANPPPPRNESGTASPSPTTPSASRT